MHRSSLLCLTLAACAPAASVAPTPVADDDTGCEWSSRWYFDANTADVSVAGLITTGALAEDTDGTRYRLWIADATFDQRLLALTLDVAAAKP